MTRQNEGKPSILIVDDEFDVLVTVAAYLKQVGDYDISIFRAPSEAVRVLEERKFDLVISDVIMPGITGLDVLKKVNHFQEECPLIFMTGYADMETTVKALKLGAFDFLVKPLDFSVLHKSVNRALALKHRHDMEKEYLNRLEDDLLTKTAHLRNSLAELEQARKSASEAHQAKLSSISGLGFEIQESLNEIAGGIERLSAGELSEEQKHDVASISHALKVLLELVDRISAEAAG